LLNRQKYAKYTHNYNFSYLIDNKCRNSISESVMIIIAIYVWFNTSNIFPFLIIGLIFVVFHTSGGKSYLLKIFCTLKMKHVVKCVNAEYT
jgi:hypothetical protein